MKIAFFSLLLLSTISFASTKVELDKAKLCTSTKEYVATMKFLRDFEGLGIKENDARSVADKVSNGCKGAFNRFFKVTTMLSKVGIDSATSIKNGVKFASSTDDKAETFIEVFKQTYGSDNLDLDSLSSLTISIEITEDMKSKSSEVLADFKKLVSYCKEEKELGLPVPFCAQMAAKITSQGGKFGKPIANEYIKLIKFISENNKGPQTDKKYSMNLAEKVISNGPTASENFIDAYKFAVSKSGLSLSAKDAISFAEQMANRSYKLESEI